jgi:thioredoxin-like negative regulator of GroEL
MNEWNFKEFSSFIEQGKTGLVYFYTPMCGTCQLAAKMLTVIEELVEMDMGKMNVNYHPSLAEQLMIESVPCLLLIGNGEVKDTIYAFHSVPYLLDKIKQVLG